jgi:hypothetical protein
MMLHFLIVFLGTIVFILLIAGAFCFLADIHDRQERSTRNRRTAKHGESPSRSSNESSVRVAEHGSLPAVHLSRPALTAGKPT